MHTGKPVLMWVRARTGPPVRRRGTSGYTQPMGPQQPAPLPGSEPPAQSPPGPPAWPQPQPPYSPPQPPSRPGQVAAAAVVLIVLGVIVALFGVAFVLFGSMFGSISSMPEFADQLGGLPPALGGFIATVGLVVLAYGILQVVAGIYVLPGKSWARITGLIVATLGALLGLALLLPGEESTTGSVVAVIVLAAYVYVVWTLTTNGRWFAR